MSFQEDLFFQESIVVVLSKVKHGVLLNIQSIKPRISSLQSVVQSQKWLTGTL